MDLVGEDVSNFADLNNDGLVTTFGNQRTQELALAV